MTTDKPPPRALPAAPLAPTVGVHLDALVEKLRLPLNLKHPRKLETMKR